MSKVLDLREVQQVLKKKSVKVPQASTKVPGYVWDQYDVPRPCSEYPFHPDRRWRFDYAWPEARLAVEIEGGTKQRGRHNRAKGYENDCEKYNAAQLMGWRVLRFIPHKGGLQPEAFRIIREALNGI